MTYSIIPNEILHDNEMKPITRLLYADICSLSNLEGYCFAMNRYFAKLYDKSLNTIIGSLKELKDKDYIKVEYTYKKESKEIELRKITPLIKVKSTEKNDFKYPPNKNWVTPTKNFGYPPNENCGDNNIKNNNIKEYISRGRKSEIEADGTYFEDNPLSDEEVIMLMNGEN